MIPLFHLLFVLFNVSPPFNSQVQYYNNNWKTASIYIDQSLCGIKWLVTINNHNTQKTKVFCNWKIRCQVWRFQQEIVKERAFFNKKYILSKNIALWSTILYGVSHTIWGSKMDYMVFFYHALTTNWTIPEPALISGLSSLR